MGLTRKTKRTAEQAKAKKAEEKANGFFRATFKGEQLGGIEYKLDGLHLMNTLLFLAEKDDMLKAAIVAATGEIVKISDPGVCQELQEIAFQIAFQAETDFETAKSAANEQA